MIKNIVFGKMTMEGFMSFRDKETWDWQQEGLNSLVAPNETGKTTLPLALQFCCYGVNMRGTKLDKVATWEWLRDENWRGTKVTQEILSGNDKYLIARHLNFKGKTEGLTGSDKLMVFLEVDGKYELQGESLHKADMQLFIEKDIIGADIRIFTNSVIFNQRKTSILEEDGTEIRKIFDELFELDFAEKAKSKAKEKIEEYEFSIKTEKDEIDKAEIYIETKKEFLEKMITKREEERIIRKETEERILSEIDSKSKELVQTTKLKDAIKLKQVSFSNFYTTRAITLNKEKALATKLNEVKENKSNLVNKININETRIEQIDSELIKNANDIKSFRDKKIEKEKSARKSITDAETQYKINLKNKIESIDNSCPTCGQVAPKEFLDNIITYIKKEQKDIYLDKLDILQLNLDNILNEQMPTDISPILSEELAKINKDLDIKYDELAELDSLEKKLNKDLDIVSEAISKEDEKEKEIQAIVDDYEQDKERRNKLKIQESVLETEIKNLEDKLETQKKTLYTFQPGEIKELESVIEKKEIIVKKHHSEVLKLTKVLDRYLFWYKTGFGNKGIKAHIYNTMVKELNRNIYKYSSKFNTIIRFSVDLEKASMPFVVDIIRGSHVVDYKELSGGAKKRCDVATAFGFYDLQNKVNNINILLLDEFTENLDPANVELCYELLRGKITNGKSIFTITHTASDLLQNKQVRLENIDGITKIIRN